MTSRDETIELWALSLESGSEERALLGARERARADRLVIDDKRAQFIAAQAGLRRVLARYTGVEPASVRFAYGEHGKPYLPAYPGLRFNMTHSGRMALVAVTHDVEIGVDLEWTGRQRPFLRLARRYFTSAEAAWLEGVSEELRPRSFYRIWTLKEAYLKAVGTGLTVPPDRFELDLDRSPATLHTTHLPGDAPGAWTFAEPEIAEDYAGAICCQGQRREIVRRDANDLVDAFGV